MNMISIQDLAACCLSENSLSAELVYQLKQLTSSYHQNFNPDKVTLCNECWKMVGKSVKFWQNMELLLSQNLGYETKLQALILICDRIKTNWYFEEQDIKNSIKAYMCSESQTYSNGEMSTQRKSIYRKINHIIVEILKYQWMDGWSSFLYDICQAMYENPLFAENYFDLLHTIFAEIFSHQDHNLTTEEVDILRQQLVKHYHHMQKCFQKYLQLETPPSTLRNCIIALSDLVEWIPSYYIYIGTIIEQLYTLLDQSASRDQAIMCLLSILDQPEKGVTDSLLSKMYTQKRKVLLSVLTHAAILKNKTTIPQLLQTCLKFLQQQKSDIDAYGIKVVLPDNEQVSTNNFILQNLIRIMEEGQDLLDIHNEDAIILYKLVVIMGKDDVVELENIIANLIQLTPFPVQHTFCLDPESTNTDFEESKNNFIEIMRNLVAIEDEVYFNYIMKEIDADYFRHKSYKLLAKILQNIYYYLEVCPPNTQVKQKVFTVAARLLVIEQKIAVSQPHPNLIKLSATIKQGINLILSHQKCVHIPMLVEVYRKCITSGFNEDVDFIRSLLGTIANCYNDLPANLKDCIHQEYVKKMVGKEGRLDADLIYLQIVGKWVQKNQKQNLELGLAHAVDIIDWYKTNIQSLKNRKLCSIRKSEIVEFEQKLFHCSLEYLQLLHMAMPYLKSELIYHIYSELPIIEYIKTIINLSDTNAESILFFKLALKILMWNFSMLTKEQINKNIELILSQCSIVIDYITRDLEADKACHENIGSMLDYLSGFIVCVADWNIQDGKKVSLITNIVTVVLSRGYSSNVPGYYNVLHSIIKCSCLPILPAQILPTTISSVYQLSSCQDQASILQCLSIMQTIYTQCIGDSGKKKLLSNYILDCITHTYMILLKLFHARHYVQEYSDILFMGLLFVRNMKDKFLCNGLEVADNMGAVLAVLIQTTRKVYFNYNQCFMTKIEKFLAYLVEIGNKQVFCQKVKDLVIILRRGY